jgi:thiol-disulfide isomerase/thioredoxin
LIVGLSYGCAEVSGEGGGTATTGTATGTSTDETDSESVDFVPPADAVIGFEVGNVIPNATLVDQNGDSIEIYDLHGTVLLLDVFAMWCGPCQAHAPDGEVLSQDLQNEDFELIALMQENVSGGAPTSADAMDWADSYGLTHPVLADADNTYNYFATLGGGYPTYPVVGPDMRVVLVDLYYEGVNSTSLRSVLEEEGIW